MTDFFNVLSALSFILYLVLAFFVAQIATRVRELQGKLERSPTSRIALLETSHAEMAEELHHLANRVKMMKVRKATDHVREANDKQTFPDPHTEPEAWRKAMNLDLARRRLGNVSN